MNLGLAQIFFYGTAQTAVKRALTAFFGENVFRLAAPDGHFLAPVGGGKNPFGRTVKNGRGCRHQINCMMEQTGRSAERRTEADLPRRMVTFSPRSAAEKTRSGER